MISLIREIVYMKKTKVIEKLDGNQFEAFNFFGLEPPEDNTEEIIAVKDDLVFKFIESASKTKKDLVKTADIPEETERKYVPFITNKSFSFHIDTILHANEMNAKHWLFKDAQYRYYLGALRPRDRRSKWFKAEKDIELDNIQLHYQCNRSVAKQYAQVLTKENIDIINNKVSKGGG